MPYLMVYDNGGVGVGEVLVGWFVVPESDNTYSFRLITVTADLKRIISVDEVPGRTTPKETAKINELLERLCPTGSSAPSSGKRRRA